MKPWLLAVLVLAGCSMPEDDDPEEPEVVTVTSTSGGDTRTYGLCGSTLNHAQFLQFFNGNLVFVAEHSEDGKSASEAIGSLVASVVVNGLDFAELASYDLSFSDGDYTLGANGKGYTFSLYFAEAFGSFAAGDKIPYNVFDYESYVTDVEITLLPTPSYDFEEGPLFALVDGEVEFDGTTLASLKPSFKVHTDKIAFEMNSKADRHGQEPRQDDVIHLSMTTTRATLTEVNEQFEAGGYGMSYTGTNYVSTYFGIDQTITGGTFFMKKDAAGFYWEGEYTASVTKDAVTYYQKGLASTRVQNQTEYYCDEAMEGLAGTALHDLDLKGGTYTFRDGTTFSYRLDEF